MRIPGHGVDDLVRQALRHEAGADQCHADRPAFFFPRFQCVIYENHVESSFSVSSELFAVLARSHAGRFLPPLAHAPFDFGSLFGQQLPDCVLLRNHRHRQRPLQSQPRIVVHQPAFGAGRVELADLVARLGLVPQHLVAVREALRHVERAVVVLAQLDGDVLQVGRALGPEVDDDVENRAPRGTHQLGLGARAETGSACRAASPSCG